MLDLVALYIPANPFNSLANNVVPAAVLFSILLGIGVFAIAAGTAGVAVLEEISRLQVYLVSYTVVALILTFVVLPMVWVYAAPIGDYLVNANM